MKETEQNFPLGFGLSIGWLSYLIHGYNPRRVYHFNPRERLFEGHFFQTLISLAVYLIWCGALCYYSSVYGFLALLFHHILPVLVFGAFILIITFLHHNEPGVPWFPNSEWNYVKGQLSTVDRHYGFVHALIHNIGTHQLHHLFTTIPHYNLEKATTAFRQKYPNLVNLKEERVLSAFNRIFKIFAKQHVIDDINNAGFKAYCYQNS